jgi:DNA-directed RNA polymerase subunit RPC12/RpoP
MSMRELILNVSVAGIIFCIMLWLCLRSFKRSEKKKWNRGRCPCGQKWEKFSHSDDIGRGYTCSRCQRFIWLTFTGIDK